MQLDWTIHLSDLLVLGAGVLAFFKVFVTIRDSLRDLTSAVGKTDPPSGLLGDVHHIEREQQQHREWLIRAGLDKHDYSHHP